LFWVGYHPHPIRKTVASVLSYAFVVFTYAVDFGAPAMQRHRVRYSQVIKAVFKRPIASFGFGAVFALGPILVGQLAARNPQWSMATTVGLVFAVNVVCIVWAAAGGTWLGCRLLPVAEASPRSRPLTRVAAWLLLLGTFAINAYAFASLGMAVHHKSQVLKCKYSVDWSSFGLDKPSLGGLLSRSVDVGVHFDLEVTNPTSVDVRLERNRLEITHGDTTVAEARLDPMEVKAGQTAVQRMATKVSLDPAALLKGTQLLSDSWNLTVYLEVAWGIEFPIYLRAAR